jgi:hydrogenase small subunit
MFEYLSLDYHHTLQAGSGDAAEMARTSSISDFHGRFLLIVDGSIPTGQGGVYSMFAGKTNLEILRECISGAAAVIAVGSCASFGGLPAAKPNPTGATGIATLMEKGLIERKELVNVPGCPPIPVAISSVLAHFLVFGRFPALDKLKRPLSIYGRTVHERCSRYRFFVEEKFAESFDDENARNGWCLYKLGCKGPITYNACAIHKWNEGTSFPIEAGHPCIGCSEPSFWDRSGFYTSLDDARISYQRSDESIQAAIESGQNLYEDNCVFCHSLDPGDLKTQVSEIPELLRKGDIRAHRRLEFSDDQLDILVKYLRSKQGS